MRAGENIRYIAPGEVRVSVPIMRQMPEGEMEEIGRIVMDQRADPRYMDPDGCFVRDGGGVFLLAFRRTIPMEVKKSDTPTSYIYRNNNKEEIYITIKHIEQEPINRVCPLCGKTPSHTMHCPKVGGMAVCEGHCTDCEHHQRGGCRYQKKPP